MRMAITVAVICGLAATAHADRADQLFKKGKKLLAEKKYAEACLSFEDSDKIDPAIGTKLNIALCFEEWGKLATAWRWYTEAEQMAERSNDPRAAQILGLIKELDATVPRLTVSLPPGRSATGLTVRLDGVVLAATALGTEQRVDPGPHQIDYVVNGVKQTKVIPVERGASSEVTLELPKFGTLAQLEQPEAPVATSDDAGAKRRLIGLGVGGAGVLAIGIAGIVVYRAHGDYDHAIDNHCNGSTDMCDDIGLSATHNARSRANVATVLTLGGLVAVAGGVYLYLTAPKGAAPGAEHALRVSPSFGSSGNGLVLSGAF